MKTLSKYIFLLSGLILLSCSKDGIDNETLALYARAQSFYTNGKLNETRDLLLPENTSGKANKFIPVLVLRGKTEYFMDNIDEAEKIFKRILKLKPAQVESALYLARIKREQDHSEEAVKIVEELLANDPSNIRALRLASQLAKEKNKDTVSLAFLDRAVEASSETALVFLDRARQNWILGQSEKAAADLLCAKSLVLPDDPLYRAVDNLQRIVLNKSALKK
ncbi:hypothetical protein AGMMS50212_12700 [Spirochaetia bacterium]|nr:hypothetical protein AGMMS50212_12700 [Spirochaetia bacterium]